MIKFEWGTFLCISFHFIHITTTDLFIDLLVVIPAKTSCNIFVTRMTLDWGNFHRVLFLSIYVSLKLLYFRKQNFSWYFPAREGLGMKKWDWCFIFFLIIQLKIHKARCPLHQPNSWNFTQKSYSIILWTFYNCVLNCLAFQGLWGWSLPCFNTNLSTFLV